MNNRKDKFGIYYHIFADNKDFYEYTRKKANFVYKMLKIEGEYNIRLYQCWYDSLEDAKSFDDCSESSECLRSFGEWPL